MNWASFDRGPRLPRHRLARIDRTAGTRLIGARLGRLPLSVMRIDAQAERALRELIGDTGRLRAHPGTHFADSPNQASVFSPALAAFMVLAYSDPGDELVDPFAGGGTRAIMAAALGRRYLGVEIRAEEADQVNARLKGLGLDRLARVEHADAARFGWPARRARLILTSPPYWSLEAYGGGPGDLSAAPTYAAFLAGIRRVIEGLAPGLGPDAFSAWVLGSISHPATGEYLDLPADIALIQRKVGFARHDRVVVERVGPAVRRVGQFEATRRTVRVHDELVVARYVGRVTRRSPAPRASGPEDTVAVKVSAASARLQFHGCEPTYIREVCKGRCCESSSHPLGILVSIQPAEAPVLEARGARIKEGLLEPEPGCRKCPFKAPDDLCSLHATPDKPFACIVGPFHLNAHGTLIVRNRYKLLRCYRDDRDGTLAPAYRHFRASLDLIFGPEEAQRICDHLDAGGGDILAQMLRSRYAALTGLKATLDGAQARRAAPRRARSSAQRRGSA